MSRSRRSTPIRGICGGSHVSEKWWKRRWQHQERMALRAALRKMPNDELSNERASGKLVCTSVWHASKDGKWWIDPAQDGGRLMRK